jgi:hypothetical protein
MSLTETYNIGLGILLIAHAGFIAVPGWSKLIRQADAYSKKTSKSNHASEKLKKQLHSLFKRLRLLSIMQRDAKPENNSCMICTSDLIHLTLLHPK